MKIYDKEMYNRQEEIRNIVIIIVTFLIGFFVGYLANSFTNNKENENEVNTLNTQAYIEYNIEEKLA